MASLNVRYDAGKHSIAGATKKDKSMEEKRLADYYKKLRGKSAVKPDSLRSTSDATAEHTVQNCCVNYLPPEQWRWKINGMCLPVHM